MFFDLIAVLVAIAQRTGDRLIPARYQFALPVGVSAVQDDLQFQKDRGGFILVGLEARKGAGGNNDLGSRDVTSTARLASGSRVLVDNIHSGVLIHNVGDEPDEPRPRWRAPAYFDDGGKLAMRFDQGAANNWVAGDSLTAIGFHVSRPRTVDLAHDVMGEVRGYGVNVSNVAAAWSAEDQDQPVQGEHVVLDAYRATRLSSDNALITGLELAVNGYKLFPEFPVGLGVFPTSYEQPGAWLGMSLPSTAKVKGRLRSDTACTTHLGFLGRTRPERHDPKLSPYVPEL